MILFITGWASWVGCTPEGDGDGPDDATPTGDTGPDTPGVEGDDEGSLVVLSWLPSAVSDEPRTVMLGIFAESREGIVNLAQCVGSPDVGFCAPSLPTQPGQSVVTTPLDPALFDELDTVDVGVEIQLGPWSAVYDYDQESEVGFYFSSVSGAALPSEPVPLTIAGDWGVMPQPPLISSPTPIEVTAPDPMLPVDLYDGTPLDLRWTPGGEGQVYLVVTTPREDRVFLLDDDGQEPVDLTPLGLPEGAAVTMMLGRWTVADVNHLGNVANVQVQSNQILSGTWHEAAPRGELVPIDECAEARSAPSTAPGLYEGDLAGFARDLDPGPGGCTGFQARGPDGLVPVDLQPNDLLTVTYDLRADDGSVYLLTDCADVATCLVGADQSQNNGVSEQIVYLNESGAVQRVYIVLDAFPQQITDGFDLDIVVDAVGGDVLVPTCVEALDQGPVPSGTYSGSLAVHADFLAPECAAASAAGEGLVQVYLEPGGTVQASVTTTAGNPGFYLMYNCAIEDSCFLGDDSLGGPTEDLVYTNLTGVAEYFFVVVDGDATLGDYVLDLSVE